MSDRKVLALQFSSFGERSAQAYLENGDVDENDDDQWDVEGEDRGADDKVGIMKLARRTIFILAFTVIQKRKSLHYFL